mgnify:CR=1 FL=1
MAQGNLNVTGGDTNVTTYFHMRLTATDLGATGLTPTNFDLTYTRSGVAPTAKVDASALGSTDASHTDNGVIEVDSTDAEGLYRVDWPDAAFAAGVKEVILTVKCATAYTEHMHVPIDAPVKPTSILAATANVLADHVLLRTQANVEASSDGDTLSYRSLYGAVAKAVNKVSISGSTMTITKSDDSTSLGTQTVTSDAAADPITALDTD